MSGSEIYIAVWSGGYETADYMAFDNIEDAEFQINNWKGPDYDPGEEDMLIDDFHILRLFVEDGMLKTEVLQR